MRILALLFFLTLNSCISGRNARQTGIEEIKFGSGGGFTGEIKSFTLTADSKLFEETKNLKEIDSKKTLGIFNRAEELIDYSFNEPGNMYSFIEIKTSERTNRIVWAYGSLNVDNKLIDLYTSLMTLVKL